MPYWSSCGQRGDHACGASTYAARVVALPISRYICLSIIAKDSASPLVYNFWPSNAVFNSRARGKRQTSTLKRRVGFAVVRSQVREGARQDGHGVRVVTIRVRQSGNGSYGGIKHTGMNGRNHRRQHARLCVG